MMYIITLFGYGLFSAWLIHKGFHWHDDELAEAVID